MNFIEYFRVHCNFTLYRLLIKVVFRALKVNTRLKGYVGRNILEPGVGRQDPRSVDDGGVYGVERRGTFLRFAKWRCSGGGQKLIISFISSEVY